MTSQYTLLLIYRLIQNTEYKKVENIIPAMFMQNMVCYQGYPTVWYAVSRPVRTYFCEHSGVIKTVASGLPHKDTICRSGHNKLSDLEGTRPLEMIGDPKGLGIPKD